MSVKSIGLGVAATVLAASLAACGQGEQQSNTASTAGASSSAASSTSGAGAMLVVEPASVDGCKPNQPVTATVSWHSKDPHVKVMAAAPSQAQLQLFSEGGYTGQAKTGNWVVANTRFELIDAETGKQLAKLTVRATQCKP